MSYKDSGRRMEVGIKRSLKMLGDVVSSVHGRANRNRREKV